MPAFALSESLESQIDALAAEVRRLRILRGASWLVAVLIAAPLAAIALDVSFELSGRARGIMLAAWIALSVVAGWWFVVRRLRESVPPEAIARLIEAKFPSLSERLRTLVELSEGADPGNGSRTMMALLARETERRTRKLDFSHAAPSAFSFRFAALTACAAVLAVAPILFVSGGGERVRRFVAPWHTPPVEVPYEIVVSSGDPVVKRGHSITVSGYLKKSRPDAVLPDSAAVIFRESGSTDEKKLPMACDDKAAFTLTRPTVTGDLEYRIESGSARSEWHTIAAVDPVEIAAGSETMITPPAYAATARPKRTLDSLADIEAIRHSRADVKLKFDRKARAVQLEWRPAGAAATAPVERLPVELDEAGTAASVAIPLKVDGTLKWILFAERDIRTEVAVAVRVQADAPPKFERVTGFSASTRDIRKSEVLTIDFAATDDLALADAILEFGPADAPDDTSPTGEPIAATGLGTTRAEGRISFRLPPSATEGQAFRVRLRIADNRSIPELDWKPQQATYPENGWAILRASSAAKPLAEQEITASNEGVRQKLEAVAKLLERAHAGVKGHRLDYQGKPKLEQDQAVRLTADLEAVRSARTLLEVLGRETSGIAALANGLSEGDVRTAELQLKRALTETDIGLRDTSALSAQHALEAALLKLAELKKAAESSAANRLDIAELDRLAREQARLAEDAKRPNPAAEPTAEQRKLREDLEKLLRGSEALKQGELDAAAQKRRGQSDELGKLGREQKDLDTAIRTGEAAADRDGIDELAKKQKRIAERVKDLAEKTDLPARIARTGPLERKSAQAATDWLDKKKPVEALTEQEKAARDLERLAEALEKADAERGDARKAAQQLARWQEDLQRRVADGVDPKSGGDSPADREKWVAEQKAIRDATRKLSLPPSAALDRIHGQAKDATADAAEQLARDPAQASESLKKATETLNRLAEKAPAQPQRAKDSLAELEKLRRERDALAKEADDIARLAKSADDPDAKSKREAVAEKQRELAKKLTALDAPGSERRREMAADANRRAAEEVAKGPSKESSAAQGEAKLQMDRLKESLDGQTPADDKAGELARLQKELTENLERVEKPTPQELERLQRAQRDIARRLAQLHAPEEPKALQDAREAAQAAEAALKKPDADIDELKKKSAQARAASQRLADKLGGGRDTPMPPVAEESAGDLPNRKAADEARKLAAEQRDLRERLTKLAEKGSKPTPPGGADPLKGLAEKQKELAGSAERLARDAKSADRTDAANRAEEAARKAHAAGRKLDVGDAEGARQEADEAAKKLGEAAKVADDPALAKRADELRKGQEELTRAAETSGDAESAAVRRRAKQGELAKQSRDMAGELERGGKPDNAEREAADALKRAGDAMEQAGRDAGNPKPGAAAKSRQQASDALAQAQKAMDDSSGKPTPGREGLRQAAEAGKQAQDLMKQAEKELAQPGGGSAGASMQKAADKLKEAAGKLGESGTGDGSTGANSGPKAGAPDRPATADVPSVVAENLGKAWGDLPDDVKSKITQELNAKYGDDYARLIKLYFEQLAERK